MSFNSLLNVTVTKTEPIQGSENEYGEYVITWDNPSSFNAALQPSTGEEVVTSGGKAIIADYKLYCPYITNIVEGDQVSYNGKLFKVVWVADDAGRLHHYKCLLKEIQ